MNDVKLDEKFFKTFFSKVNLGERSDVCISPGDLAGAVPKLWATALEVEYTSDLWLSALIGTGLRDCIIEKTELERLPGDTIYISKADQLSNLGELGDAHLLEGDEENIDLSYLPLRPVRRGNAVCWSKKSGHSTAFDLKQAAKSLLASWIATKIERLLMASLAGATNILYSGVATDINSIQQTDTLSGADLLRGFISLLGQKAKGIGKLNDHYAFLCHPLQYYDLMQSGDFITTLAQASQQKTLDIAGYVSSYSRLKIFVSTELPVELNEASPGCAVYTGYFLAARALALAWQQRPSWLTKYSSYGTSPGTGELQGIGSDMWNDTAILRQNAIVAIKSGATPLQVTQ